jgi:hypothetical protein
LLLWTRLRGTFFTCSKALPEERFNKRRSVRHGWLSIHRRGIMADQETITLLQSDEADGEPLQLAELLTLIKLADDNGYSVKVAREMKNLYDANSTDLYSVWYAIENELPIFVKNIPDLIKLTGWVRHQSSLIADDIDISSAS